MANSMSLSLLIILCYLIGLGLGYELQNILIPSKSTINADQIKSLLSSVKSSDVISSSVFKSYEDDFILFDEVFKSKTNEEQDGLTISVETNHINLSPTFENLNSNNFFGCKLTDLCTICTQNILFQISGKDFPVDQTCFEQCFRRIVRILSLPSDNNSSNFQKSVFLLVNTAGVDIEGSDERNKFSAELLSIVESMSKEYTETLPFKLSVHYANFSNKQSLEKMLGTVSSSQTVISGFNRDEYISSLMSIWNKLSTEVPKPVYSKEEKISLFKIETAFTLGLSQIESVVSLWQKRVGVSGKLVGKFADRVMSQLKSVQSNYFARTSGVITVRERNRRWIELKENFKLSVTSLFNQQFAILQSKTSAELRDALINVPELTSEIESQELRNALFKFRAAMADLEIEEFGLKLTPALISDISSKLQTLVKELPESPMAKLMELKKLDEQTKSQKKRKGQRSLNVALNLVGMLRPSGLGNLQGYANYATSLLGLPLELLLGFQNDGDSPEIMGDDREYPLLRLQPKIHFDIDL